MPKVVLSDDVDHEFGIATGLELKELVAEKQGIKLFDYLDPTSGPFGTKEERHSNALGTIESYLKELLAFLVPVCNDEDLIENLILGQDWIFENEVNIHLAQGSMAVMKTDNSMYPLYYLNFTL